MLIGGPLRIPWSEITPKRVYLSRRRFLAGAAAAGAMGAGYRLFEAGHPRRRVLAGARLEGVTKSPFSTGEKQTPLETITHYNNFYEFGTEKEQPAERARNFQTRPWMIQVDGAVSKPRAFDLDMVMKLAPLEERIYRHRCVEGWSIVVPWIGFPLAALIRQVEPASKAKYVAFQSVYDSKRMLSPWQAGIPFPYVEGLRLDEAMNPLAILCVGLYGEVLPNQNGAPVRLVVPWKYGFKSIKSIVRISFVEKQPVTTWSAKNPGEYGFYSNVNPAVDHPRWSQAAERRLGELLKRPTLLFNGYGDQVAGLYTGMDLRKSY